MRILLCQIPHLHLGYLGCYGNDWVPTVHLDRLAAEAVVFDQHYSDGGNQEQSILSGQYAFRPSSTEQQAPIQSWIDKGVRVVQADIEEFPSPNDDKDPWYELTQPLKEVGPTLLRIRFPSLAPPWEIADSFLTTFFADEETEFDPEQEEDHYEEDFEEEDFEEKDFEEEMIDDEAFEDTDSDVELEEEIEHPAPLFDPPDSVPTDAGDVFHERLRLTYAAKITELDEAIGSLRTSLEEQGVLEEIVWVLIGDNGLSLGEHGYIGTNAPWLNEEHIHRLLLVRLPNGEQHGRRVHALTQAVDLCPTLAEWFSVDKPDTHGYSLCPVLRGEQETLREYVVVSNGPDSSAWALRCPDWALLVRDVTEEEREVRLYEKPEDRWEVSDLQQLHLDWCSRLEETLFQFREATQNVTSFQPPPLPDMEKDEEK